MTFMDNGDGTATLGGTPDVGTGGIYKLTITAANGVGSDATQNFTLTVAVVPPGARHTHRHGRRSWTARPSWAPAPSTPSASPPWAPTPWLSARHSITAVYAGDTNFATSTSPVLSQVVDPADTTTTLTSDANPSVSGQSVTFTATVRIASPGTNDVANPTGTVTFYDGGVSIGTGTLSNTATDTATFTTSALATATHSITAAYTSGDSNFTASRHVAVDQPGGQQGQHHDHRDLGHQPQRVRPERHLHGDGEHRQPGE